MSLTPERALDGTRDEPAQSRSEDFDSRLGLTLTAVAGAVNAGGFVAVGQYTSHMSGIVSSMADNFAIGEVALVIAGTIALGAFIAGAACSAILINWGRRNGQRRTFALPLVLEACLLLVFGIIGKLVAGNPMFPAAVMLLCFIMGLQNAIITKISKARIRTTHVTGMVTDLGIELGKLLYLNTRRGPDVTVVRADRRSMRLHASMLSAFFAGGLAGALGFAFVGFLTTLPLAAVLLGVVWIGVDRHEDDQRTA